MRATRAIISANLDNHNHLEEYFKIIEIIEANENVNPDICIESCKALVEGISKTILIELDATKTAENIDDDNLPKLFNRAMRLLSDECEDLEGDFVVRFSSIIQVLGEIRNKRGDISHGRMAPKAIFSSAKLASTVKNMTESMLEYILEHYFRLDFTSKSKFKYDSKEMLSYNNWLDESVDFPIKKASYSKLLFENDYDEYENRYQNEFKTVDIDEELKEKLVSLIELLRENAIKLESEKSLSKDKEVDKKEPEVIVEVENSTLEYLVNKFNEDLFWTEKRNLMLSIFVVDEELKLEEFKELVNDILFTEKEPLRDDVRDVMIKSPALLESKKVLPELTAKILKLIEELKAEVEE